MTDSVDLPIPARALAIGAHPDDIEFGCGATLSKWAAAGCNVHLLVLTDGSKGTWDADADLGALVARRRAEQQEAATVIGATAVHMLDSIDGELSVTLPMRAQVCEIIRRTRPDVVLGHDPWKRYRLHPDHVAAGQLTIDGIVAARDPHFFREQGLVRHRPNTLLLFEAEVRDHFELVDDYIDVKIEALLAHRSQYESTHGIHENSAAQLVAFTNKIRTVAGAAAQDIGAGERFAEAFKRIDDL